MKVPFTWRPTGWFMIGWSEEFPVGSVAPLRYFGDDLVAYRDDDGDLHVLAAHCPHLGAHIGHGGKVDGACVVCPYHGWVWDAAGENVSIPYEDRPNRSKRLRSWSVAEQHGCVFLWHQPDGDPPRWEVPDIFAAHPQFDTDPAHYYRPYPEMSIRYDAEPVHPQIPLENAPDSMHFRYVHRSSTSPVLLSHEALDQQWRFVTGWPRPGATSDDDIALHIHSTMFGVGGAISAFSGADSYRLIFATTPVDDTCSNMFYSIWWPRRDGDQSDVPPADLRERVEKEFLSTLWDDLEIWRYQVYVEHPALARQDAKPYGSLRRWARQFYEIDPATESGGASA